MTNSDESREQAHGITGSAALGLSDGPACSRPAGRTFAKAHDSAAETYGEGERAHRVAYGAVKHTFEKKGDHWEPKGHKGPSDERAADPRARENHGRSAGGVDVRGSSRKELMERAARLGVRGRSKMTKQELGEAIARKQD